MEVHGSHTVEASLGEFWTSLCCVWDECNSVVVWTFFGVAFFWDQNENWTFPVLWALLNFQTCWHIECSTFTASSFRVWNFSTGIPSLPVALLVVMFPKATWLHIPGCLALGEWSHHCGYLGPEDLFCVVLLCILATSFNYLLLLLGPYRFCPLLWLSLHEMFFLYLWFSWRDLQSSVPLIIVFWEKSTLNIFQCIL